MRILKTKNLVLTIAILISTIQSFAQQWTILPSGTTEHLKGVYFTSGEIGYVVGYHGTIKKTVDGGNNWIQLNSGTTHNLNSVYFVSTSTGYAVGDTGTILKTSNNGSNWSTIYSEDSMQLNSVYFLNASIGYAVGHSVTSIGGELGIVLKTANSGATWTKISLDTIHSRFFDVHFKTELIGYICGAQANGIDFNSIVKKTSDGGNTWQNYYSGSPGLNVNCMSFIDSLKTFIGEGGIWETLNNGASWGISGVGLSVISSSYFVSDSIGFFVGYGGGGVLKTINAGTYWAFDTSNTLAMLYHITFINDTGFIVGANGIILKRILSLPSTIKENPFTIQSEIFPNPINENSFVKLTLSKSEFISIKVTDELGRVVKQIPEKYFEKGENRIEMDCHNLIPGIYFLNLSSRNFSQTEKLIIAN